jgi:MFS family permease
MGVLSLFGFGLSLALLPPTREESVVRKGRPPAQWSIILTDRILAGLFFFRLAYTACIGIIWGFLPVLADMEFSASASAIGILVMLGISVSGVMHVPMGWLADRFNRKVMVILGGLVAAVAVHAFNFTTGFQGMLWASVVFGIGGGISMPALMAAAVLRGSSSDAMGSVMALLTVAHSLGMLLGSVFAGVMMDWFELRQAFVFGSALMAAGTLWFTVCTWSVDLSRETILAPAPQITDG